MESLISFVSNEQGFNCISSLMIAQIFDREHKNILRQIKILEDDGRLLGSLSELSEYQDSTGRKLPMYLLTDVGFTFLIASFDLKDEQDILLRSEIIQKFAKARENEIKQLKKLKQRNEALEASEKKALASEYPRRKTAIYGYILEDNGTEFPTRKRVLKEEYDELELIEGELSSNHSIIHGLTLKNTKLYARKDEILTLC